MRVARIWGWRRRVNECLFRVLALLACEGRLFFTACLLCEIGAPQSVRSGQQYDGVNCVIAAHLLYLILTVHS